MVDRTNSVGSIIAAVSPFSNSVLMLSTQIAQPQCSYYSQLDYHWDASWNEETQTRDKLLIPVVTEIKSCLVSELWAFKKSDWQCKWVYSTVQASLGNETAKFLLVFFSSYFTTAMSAAAAPLCVELNRRVPLCVNPSVAKQWSPKQTADMSPGVADAHGCIYTPIIGSFADRSVGPCDTRLIILGRSHS